MVPDREKLAEQATGALSLDSRLLEKLDKGLLCAVERAAQAMNAIALDAEIGERFEVGLRATLEAAAAQPDLTRLCLVEAPGLGARALAQKDVGLQRFVDLLDAELAQQHGQAPPLVSEMVVGGIYEVVQRAARADKIGTLPDLAGQLSQLWLPALRGR